MNIGRSLLGLGLALLALAVACGDDDDATATPIAASPTATAAGPIVTLNVCVPNPAPAAPGVVSVDQPALGAQVRSPLHVSGRGVPIEGIFVTLYDSRGLEMARVAADIDTRATPQPVAGGGESLPFSAQVAFSVTSQQPACLWVHKTSGRDGSPAHVVQAPVTLLP